MSSPRFCFVNISGITFCISSRVLRRHPYTKLASTFEITHSGNITGVDIDTAVFFDRNPVIFCSVLDFYRTGQLHVPHSFCYSTLKEELDFWQIDIGHLSECCAQVREHHKKRIQEIKYVQRVFGDDEIRTRPKEGIVTLTAVTSPFRYRLNLLFNNTHDLSDWVKSVYCMFYLTCVVSHLVSYIAQSDQRMDIINPATSFSCSSLINASLSFKENSSLSNAEFEHRIEEFSRIKYSKYFLSRPSFALRAIDMGCMLFFATDTILRAISVDSFRSFAIKISNWVDIACTSANLIAFSLSIRSSDGVTFFGCNLAVLTVYLILEIFRVLRLGRLLQFASKYNGIIVLLLTVRHSLYELGLLLAALGSGVVFFGFLAFIADIGDPSSLITSFPVGFWWAVVTMTTLGYGDVVPATVFGYIIGSMCAISGVIFMAVQVPVIGNKFNAFYIYACKQSDSTNKKKQS